jgi:hypothetical protein
MTENNLSPRDRPGMRFAPSSRRAAAPAGGQPPEVLVRLEPRGRLSQTLHALGCQFSSCFPRCTYRQFEQPGPGLFRKMTNTCRDRMVQRRYFWGKQACGGRLVPPVGGVLGAQGDAPVVLQIKAGSRVRFVVSDLLYSIGWVLCPATLVNAHSPELGLPQYECCCNESRW